MTGQDSGLKFNVKAYQFSQYNRGCHPEKIPIQEHGVTGTEQYFPIRPVTYSYEA
jgi:hypothetical protein